MKNIKTYLLLLTLALMAVACEPDAYEVPDIEKVPVKTVFDISYTFINSDGVEKTHTSKDDARIPYSITLYDTKDMMTWYKDARAIDVKEVANKDESASTEEEFIISFDTVEKVSVTDAEGNASEELVVENFSINTSKINESHGTMIYTFMENGAEVSRTYSIRARKDEVYN